MCIFIIHVIIRVYFLFFAGWRPLVTVWKLPSVLQSWRLSTRKGGSLNITGQTKGKASGKAWKHPSGKITPIFLHHICCQSIIKTLLWLLTFRYGKEPLSKCLCSRAKHWGNPIYGGIKAKDFILLEFRQIGRGGERKSTCNMLKAISMKK